MLPYRIIHVFLQKILRVGITDCKYKEKFSRNAGNS